MTSYQVTTPRGREAHLEARDQTSDLSVIGSSFGGVAGSPLQDEYGLADLHIEGRFVDVGAHVGSVAVAVLLDNPGATALLVEPIPENVQVIIANLAANGLADRAEILEGAVGTNQITYGFEDTPTLANNRYIGNLNVSPLRGAKTIKVRRVRLRDLLPAAAMKVDCEGGEWSLFAEKAITTIPLVFGEYHGKAGAEGVLATFGKTHKVTFTDMGQTTGGFRAVAR